MPAPRSRRPRHVEEADAADADLGRLLDQPGGALRPRQVGRAAGTERRLVRGRRLPQGEVAEVRSTRATFPQRARPRPSTIPPPLRPPGRARKRCCRTPRRARGRRGRVAGRRVIMAGNGSAPGTPPSPPHSFSLPRRTPARACGRAPAGRARRGCRRGSPRRRARAGGPGRAERICSGTTLTRARSKALGRSRRRPACRRRGAGGGRSGRCCRGREWRGGIDVVADRCSALRTAGRRRRGRRCRCRRRAPAGRGRRRPRGARGRARSTRGRRCRRRRAGRRSDGALPATPGGASPARGDRGRGVRPTEKGTARLRQVANQSAFRDRLSLSSSIPGSAPARAARHRGGTRLQAQLAVGAGQRLHPERAGHPELGDGGLLAVGGEAVDAAQVGHGGERIARGSRSEGRSEAVAWETPCRRALTPPAPLSQPPSHPTGREGRTARARGCFWPRTRGGPLQPPNQGSVSDSGTPLPGLPRVRGRSKAPGRGSTVSRRAPSSPGRTVRRGEEGRGDEGQRSESFRPNGMISPLPEQVLHPLDDPFVLLLTG